MRHRLGAAAVLSVVCATLVVVTGGPSQAAPLAVRVSRSAPLVGEYVKVSGAVPPAKRIAQLQVARGGRWVAVTSTRTGAGGRYAFTVRASSTANRYRVYAPKVKRSAARSSGSVGVRGTKPSLTFAAPVVDGAGRTQAAATAMFIPARPGTAVQLYRQVGSRLTHVATSKQASNGVARFGVLPAGTASSPWVYRAVATPGGGAPSVAASATSMKLSAVAFSDEFNGPGPELRSKWHTREQNYFSHRNCSKPADGLVTVGGGVATLRVKRLESRAGCSKGAWAFPMVGTPHLAKPYGYYAARIQFQHDRGMHGGFWLQGGTEIDVVEHFGYHRPISNLLHSGAVDTGPSVGGDQPQSRAILGHSTPYSASHVYSVQWSPTGYVFRLDGVPTLVTDKKKASSGAEIILSLGISDWEMPALNTATVGSSSAAMRVDWVRAWQ